MSGGDSTHTTLLNRVESKAFRLINSPPLTDCLDSLSHQHDVASLFLFCLYFHADCSSELANCMPPPLPRPRCTRLSTSSHPYSVHLPDAIVNQYFHPFISYIGKLWNSVPLSFSTCLWLKLVQKRSVKTSLMLTGPPPIAFFLLLSFLQDLATSRIFVCIVFLFSLNQYPFDVKKKNVSQ